MSSAIQTLFHKYTELLLKWNKVYNLTAITDPNEIATKHFEDSLRLIDYIPSRGRMLDVGTGAGFPGIPVAISLADLEVTLLDRRDKKILFCEEVIRALNLKNVRAVSSSLENFDISIFDVVVSRATFKAKEFFDLVIPHLKPGAKAILMKGPDWKKETEGLSTPFQVFEYRLSDGSQRALLQVG